MTAEAHDASVHDTIPKLLLRNAKVRGARPAMREKDLGIWQTWSWADTLTEVRDLALGLRALGLKRGDRVAIVGDNRPRLYWAICSATSSPVPTSQVRLAIDCSRVGISPGGDGLPSSPM